MSHAKRLFDKIKALVDPIEGRDYESDRLNAYDVNATYGDHYAGIKYRVDCGGEGSFCIYWVTTEEVYNVVTDDWDVSACDSYCYVCQSGVCEEYPELPIESATDIIDNEIKYLQS